MCMFAGPPQAVRRVRGTSILARALPGGRQTIVYSMSVRAREPVAMILPLPVPQGCPEDAVRFIDLSAYPTFFQDLYRVFPDYKEPRQRGKQIQFGTEAVPRPPLKVHDVGRFEASFVPTRADFDRIDERFRMGDHVWNAMPSYADYGFAVFQLKDLEKRKGLLGLLGLTQNKTVHPMAFEFPSRDPGELFFPTVHVHDGRVHERARFDHHLYAQPLPGMVPDPDEDPWVENYYELREYVDAERAAEVLDVDQPVYNLNMKGRFRNADVVLPTESLWA